MEQIIDERKKESPETTDLIEMKNQSKKERKKE